jgi:hypothetical protein
MGKRSFVKGILALVLVLGVSGIVSANTPPVSGDYKKVDSRHGGPVTISLVGNQNDNPRSIIIQTMNANNASPGQQIIFRTTWRTVAPTSSWRGYFTMESFPGGRTQNNLVWRTSTSFEFNGTLYTKN